MYNNYSVTQIVQEQLLKPFTNKRVVIPEEIIELIKKELIVEYITQPTYKNVLAILKKLELRSMYTEIPNICFRIDNSSVPILSHELEQKVIEIFKQFVVIYHEQYSNNNDRKQLPSMCMITRYIFERLGYQEFLLFLPSLNSPDNISRFNEIWNNIATRIDWGIPKYSTTPITTIGKIGPDGCWSWQEVKPDDEINKSEEYNYWGFTYLLSKVRCMLCL